LSTAERIAVMEHWEQLFRQMRLSQCRQNASAAARTRPSSSSSSEMNLSGSTEQNLTCQEAANEMREWRYDLTE